MGDAEKIRKDVARVGRSGRGARYPAGLRERVVEYCHECSDRGVGVQRVAAELGLSWKTLTRWNQASRSRFQRVEVVGAEVIPRQRHTLHGPRGTRIEHLGLEEIAELLRRLS
jgi:hypothetical protein